MQQGDLVALQDRRVITGMQDPQRTCGETRVLTARRGSQGSAEAHHTMTATAQALGIGIESVQDGGER